MNPFKIFKSKPAGHQLVVVLQGANARWFRWQGRLLVDSYTELLKADTLGGQSHCPWLGVEEGQAECTVKLVLDTCHDEIDRVKVTGMSSGWRRTLQRRAMARRLRHEYPLASIHQLPDYAAPDVLSIVHHIIPAEWEEWLKQLQAQKVCITHVATSVQLLSEYACEGAAVLKQISRPSCSGTALLFNLLLDNECRHLLVDQGIPIFMRMVDADEAGEIIAADGAVFDSLKHIEKQITDRQSPIPVATLLSPWPELEQSLQPAGILAALSCGFPVELRQLSTCPDQEDRVSTASVGASLFSFKSRFLTRMRGGWQGFRGQFKSSRAERRRWQLSHERSFVSELLQPSIIKNTLRLRIRQLQKATLICAWMATASVVIASVHGVKSARQRAALTNQKQELTRQIDTLAKSVNELNDKPEFVARSMVRIDQHAGAKPMGAVGVLATVASAIDDYPAILLDSLFWSVMPDNQPLDLAYTALSQVPQREELWHADSNVERLQVEISGTVSDEQGQGLREQQQILESFVDHLQSLPALLEVKVMESPVNAARSSEHVDDHSSAYRLSLQMRTY